MRALFLSLLCSYLFCTCCRKLRFIQDNVLFRRRYRIFNYFVLMFIIGFLRRLKLTYWKLTNYLLLYWLLYKSLSSYLLFLWKLFRHYKITWVCRLYRCWSIIYYSMQIILTCLRLWHLILFDCFTFFLQYICKRILF